MSVQVLDILFPLPSLPPSVLAPFPGPGATNKSAEALVKLLKENHTRFHCFFNDLGYHNHLSHHLLAAFFLGATPPLLQAAFDSHANYLKPAYPSPSPIDINNWKEHLGDEDYYKSYLTFFSSELVNHGLEPTLEKFFFSTEANWGAQDGDQSPQMLSRLLAGLVHPFIYAGYGMEFGQLGMVAEGFAQAAVHKVKTSLLISRELFAPRSSSVTLTTALLSRLTFRSNVKEKSSGIHSFDLLARMLKDDRLAPTKYDVEVDYQFAETVSDKGEVIRHYVDAWDIDVSSPSAIALRLQEMAWVVVLIYGVGGWRMDRPFRADFFLMHLVTSSIFLPSMLANLSEESKRRFLHSYFAVVLGYWVSQGRPKLAIKGFYKDTSTSVDPPGKNPIPNPETLDKEHLTPNPWYPLLQSTMMHPGEHVVKLERALAHYASMYGTTPQNHFVDTELEGAGHIDGTLFLRVAWLSLNRNGWVREGEQKGDWDFEGIYV